MQPGVSWSTVAKVGATRCPIGCEDLHADCIVDAPSHRCAANACDKTAKRRKKIDKAGETNKTIKEKSTLT